MGRRAGISVRQLRVSHELRKLRRARKLTCQEVAKALECSVTKISRMETGERGLYVDDVAAILGFLQAPATLRQELLDLVRHGQERNWHTIQLRMPSSGQDDFNKFERGATAIYTYGPLLIPGLGQTADYARALVRGVSPQLPEADADAIAGRGRTAR